MPGRTHQSPVGETAGAGYGCFVSAVATELISVLLPAASTHSLARSRLISKVRAASSLDRFFPPKERGTERVAEDLRVQTKHSTMKQAACQQVGRPKEASRCRRSDKNVLTSWPEARSSSRTAVAKRSTAVCIRAWRCGARAASRLSRPARAGRL
jgi:hypothetical protein